MARVSITNTLTDEPIRNIIVHNTEHGFKISLSERDGGLSWFAISANDAQLLQSQLFMHIKELRER